MSTEAASGNRRCRRRRRAIVTFSYLIVARLIAKTLTQRPYRPRPAIADPHLGIGAILLLLCASYDE